MADADHAAERTITPDATGHGRLHRDGPFWLALVLATGGLGVLLFGSVTILPWIENERTRQSIRSVWLALSRNLPDLGPDSLVRGGFWVLLVLIALLSIGLLVLASTVRDDPEPGAEPPA